MSAGAQTNPLALFGRAMQVSVTPQNGGQSVTITSTPNTPSLRVIFSIDTFILMNVWQATITLYNLASSTANTVANGSAVNNASGATGTDPLLFTQQVNMGDVISISGGYQPSSGAFSPAANLLYTGNLLQAIGTREDAVDTKLILRCITNLAIASFGYANFPRAKGQNDFDVIQQIIKNVGLAISNIDAESQQILQNQTYSRGQAVFDRPFNAIDQICKQHSIFPWVDQKGLNIRAFGSGATASLTPAYTYSPPNLQQQNATASTGTIKTTILGVPQQTQNGVIFRVLMDSQVQLGNVVAITTGTAINGFQFPYGTLPPLPNASGTYIVAGLRHVGDTRGHGDDWYTEITGMTPQFFSTLVAVKTTKK